MFAPLGRLYSSPVFDGVRVAHLFSFLRCVFLFLFIFVLCREFPILPVALTFMCNIDCLLNVPSIYRRRPS